jgi:16S rRNA (guanine527-N7)-methyltransferase
VGKAAVASLGDEHSAYLVRLGVPNDVSQRLFPYLALVAAWNERTNLTGARNAEDRVRILVADAWRAAAFLDAGTLVDIGSGNGSPGLVLALVRRDLRVTLLEPRSRRWAFLREAVRALKLDDIEVRRTRCEDFSGPEMRTATLRAVGLDLEQAARLVEAGGKVLVFGGRPDATTSLELLAHHPLESSELHVFRKLHIP